MDKVLTAKDIQEQYGFSKRKTDELMSLCRSIPRKPRGKRMVTQTEFEKVLHGGKK